MNNKNTSSPVCLVLAFLALQPFAVAQNVEPTPAAPTPAATAPAAPSAAAAGEKAATAEGAEQSGIYSIEKTDFNGQNRPIKEVLKEVADLFGFNVSIPDELDGPVPDSLSKVTWQAFYTQILQKKGYVWRVENDIVVVEKKKNDLKEKIKKLESGAISVDFDKVPVSEAVAAICEVMEKNYSPLPADLEGAAPAAPGQPTATGPKLITMHWKGISWQKTLSEILGKYGYGFKEEDGIVRVLSLEILNNVPSETRVYRVNFADAKVVADTINGVFKASGPALPNTQGSSLLTATSESSQQLVIVTAKPDFLRNSESNILAMISQIDQPAKQVIIESKIIERTWNNGFELGFRGAYGAGNTQSSGSIPKNGTANALNGNVSSSAATLGNLTSNSATAPASFVLSEKDFKFFMDALETDKSANVLQNPTLVVKDDGKGAIRIIKRVPYFETQSQASTAATTVSVTTKFINIGASLYIKPKIKGSGFVELKIDQAEAGGALTGGGTSESVEGNGGLSLSASNDKVQSPSSGSVDNFVPVTDNRDIRTTVLLRDGYTVGLGGLVKDGDSKLTTQVPILGDIPVLGRLFQAQETSKEKVNLMAFITARIIDPYNSSYRDMIGAERVHELGLSSREIEGGSYKISDAEREALDELMHKRDLDANANKAAAFNRDLNGASN